MTPRVAIVTVTYGDRGDFVASVVRGLGELEGKPELDVVVVDNGAAPGLEARLRPLRTDIRVLTMGRNTGSAGGFAAGIEHAFKHTHAEFLWLLDDDNVPERDALAALFSAYERLGSDPRNTLASLREDRPQMTSAVRTGKALRLPRNAFLGFDLATRIGRRLGLAPARGGDSEPDGGAYTPTDFAPYGGFFFHRSWIERIGYPNVDYYLYVDDHEYTNRVVRHGGSIRIVPDSVVRDLERSHRFQTRARNIYVDLDYPADRAYFEIRNKAHFDREAAASPSAHALNRAVYLVYLFTYLFLRPGAFRAKTVRAALIRKALRDARTLRSTP
jgi:GT2 family glycosyltransferase